jgi:hypothetical protein
MKNNFLIKKEIKDFLFSYKSVLIVIVAAIAPRFLQNVKNIFLPVWIQILLVQTVTGQYIYDSYQLDVKQGGILFLINGKISFLQQFLVKLSVATLGAIIATCCLAYDWKECINYLDYMSIFLSFFYCGALMFIATVISDGEEIGTAIIVIIIMAAILFLY